MAAKPLEKPIAKRRASRGLLEGEPQKAIAARLGVSESAISRFKARHAAELAGDLETIEDYTTKLVLRGKERRIQRLHEYLAVAEQVVVDRGGFIAREPKQLKDEVVMVERTDGVLLNGLRGLLEDIAAEEGARVKAPLVSVTNQVLVRSYDTPDLPS